MVDFIFIVAEFWIISSYLFRNIIILRIITIIGMSIYVLGSFLAGFSIPGMKTIFFFSCIVIIINIYQCIQLVLDKRPLLLPEVIREIYINFFSMMTTRDFYKLYQLASIKKIKKGQYLAHQDDLITDIIIILSGSVSVIKNNIVKAQLTQGYFVGEMSFILGGYATATVIVDENLTVLVWKKSDITKLEQKNPDLYLEFKQAIVNQLIKKLL